MTQPQDNPLPLTLQSPPWNTLQCRTCGQWKPPDDFLFVTPNGRRRRQCRACAAKYDHRKYLENPEYHRQYRRDIYAADPEPQRASSRQWKAENPGQKRAEHMLYKYGITEGARDDLLAAQGGVCAICGTTEWGNHPVDTPNIDHCHVCETNGAWGMDIVRGILCQLCNRGHNWDKVAGWGAKADAYLLKHTCVEGA